MRIYFASDHAGFEMKNSMKEFVGGLHYEVEDCGAYEMDPDDDYTLFISRAAEAVSKDPANGKAIIFGGSGQGEAIVANKFPHVRAVEYYGPTEDKDHLEIVRLSREHNDANILSIGARFVSLPEAREAIELWLKTPFSNEERHVRRIAEIDNIN